MLKFIGKKILTIYAEVSEQGLPCLLFRHAISRFKHQLVRPAEVQPFTTTKAMTADLLTVPKFICVLCWILVKVRPLVKSVYQKIDRINQNICCGYSKEPTH